MGKIAEANARMYKNVFVCKNCQHKMKADPLRVLEQKIKCRTCKKRAFRPVKKK